MQRIDQERIGQIIKEKIKAKGMSAEDLADRIFIDPSRVYKMYHGERANDLFRLVDVANVLGIDVRELVEAGIVEGEGRQA